MSANGWVMIAISWIVIFSLVVFCYSRIFRLRRTHMKAPLEIDTEDD